MDMVMQGAGDFGDQAMNNPASSIYLFLQQLPWAGLTTIVATVLAIVFFVTSGDSGALVLSNFTYRLENVNNDAPAWMRTLWAVIIGALTLALLMAGGLDALQSAVVVTGLPFSIVLFFMMFGLFRSLRTEGFKERSHIAAMSGDLSGRISAGGAEPGAWRKRLSRAMRFPDQAEAERFLAETGRRAMAEVRDALAGQGVAAEIETDVGAENGLALRAAMADEQDFVYGIWPTPAIRPAFATRPQSAKTEYFRLEVHLIDGSQGYDLMHYSQAQIIDDILDQYERLLTFLHMRRHAFGGVKPIAGE
ncbi:BCCT family transporter [Endozoicomonas sp. G2_2]|uniref:BCCT family transporter n=1 Tax=Gammaproteobacteria TaxID=1236 RepID=UPI001FFDF393|nr:BCCT family transporter [Endozoicomonas sp. G2_2]